MSNPWWGSHDPDLGRERGSKYLGKRDWNWFTASGPDLDARAEFDHADIPWASRRIQDTDRHDRTLGIPDRSISMWPRYGIDRTAPDELVLPLTADQSRGGSGDRERAEDIVNSLLDIPARPGPPDVSAGALAAVLGDLAPLVYGRSPERQTLEISRIARRHDIDTSTLMNLARKTGELIARTTQQPASQRSGHPNLNRLLHADLDLASELFLARTTLSTALAYSDADLPRLWILANALHHGTPTAILTTQPARSQGPGADLRATHSDLVGWRGIRTAVEQLLATVDAANEGWERLKKLPHHGSLTGQTRFIALGILQLTHPATANELALKPKKIINAGFLRQLATRHRPIGITDLSDPALKAVCHRNNWLLGTPDERTQRELVERHITTALSDEVRAQLAHGDTRALTEALTVLSPSDYELDQAVWRDAPPSDEALQYRETLDLASREVIYEFTGVRIRPLDSMSAALAGRFPDRLSLKGLHVERTALMAEPATSPLSGVGFEDSPQLDFDL